MPSLARLRAPGCHRFTDRGISQLTRLHTTLMDLSLGPMPGLTDAGLPHLAALTSLTQLELWKCRGLTDAGVRRLVALRCLSVLVLSGGRVSVEGIMALSSLTRLAKVVF